MADPILYPVNEMFQTIQGEAHFTGTPAVFIRLQGCAVGCPWCDTKHTWALEPDKEWPLGAILGKEADGPTYERVTAEQIASEAQRSFKARHAVITGGEPCDHDLTELDAALCDRGFVVQVETSGTRPLRVGAFTWVTLSPKLDMPGGQPFLPASLERAQELKMPVGKLEDVAKLEALLAGRERRLIPPIIWLQPLSQSEKATKICVEAATARNWRVSIQTHKFLGVR